jgi:hypothetical protein
MRLLFALFATIAIGAPARTDAREPAPDPPRLDVPYLPQSEALCGGAAVAMVFRYWGDRHADVQQFAPLVDRRAGGIEADRLTRAVEARGWQTEVRSGSLEMLRQHLAARQPPVLLIEDRPARYHFVVAVAADDREVLLHDPAWGPSRAYPIAAFLKAWNASGNWMLLILPGGRQAADTPRQPAGDGATGDACDAAVDAAVAEVGERGFDKADEVLARVRQQCPQSSRPLSELAGVRFAQRRYVEADALARQALALDPADEYGWDVLASSRFVRDDVAGALRAWNAIDRPQLDSLEIVGVERTRYSLFAQALPLVPNTVVTARGFALTERRVADLPSLVSSRVALKPVGDGWATATVAAVERRARPRGWADWTTAAARAAVDREIRADVPGWTGQGEVWSAGWRWWEHRPRVLFGFAAPAPRPMSGVWRVSATWEAQEFAHGEGVITRETRLHGGAAVSDWMAPGLRWEMSAGLDAWNGVRRAVPAAARLEQRLAGDRVSIAGGVRYWIPLADTTAFRGADVRLDVNAPPDQRGFAWLGEAGFQAVSDAAPPSEWPAPGDSRTAAPLLRAHPLTRRGIVDSPAFGRSLTFASAEGRRWFETPALVSLAVAVFVDAARAARGFDYGGGPVIVDAGVGLRVRWPARAGTLRLDYGRGLRDGRHALTVGWHR